ncbi:MAG: tautomerase family protein [Coriobacteriia bacterium]|nr:tautomerase family protein [Coriobacteriia bacterium]
MPIVRIDVTGPKTPAYKRAVMAGVRAAVTSELGADDGRVTLRIFESAGEDLDMPSCRTDRFTVIDVLMYEGRTAEMKAAAAAAMRASLLADPGIEACEVSVAFHSMSKVDLDVMPGEA